MRRTEDVKAYCDKHRINEVLQSALQQVVDEAPADPFTLFSEIFKKAAAAAPARHNMADVFMQFDVDGDGKLTIEEFARAFRALGLQKRSGKKLEMDVAMFKSFDLNNDGFASLLEIEAGLFPKTRKKIEAKLDDGWKFDKARWEASVARHARWDMSKVFKQFDTDGDAKLTIEEFARAFRALGLPKRDGTKLEMDREMFKSFDTNGDGVCDLEEIEKGLNPKTRKKIEEKLDAGWKFDKERWQASVSRHHKYNMAETFAQFDVDGDKKLTIHELARAFRALGLPKRDGSKLEVDVGMFNSFDTNGDGFCDLMELEMGLKPKTRKKIEQKLEDGWKFDKEKWEASVARHARWDMSKVYKQFDTDGDGKLSMREFRRAFRALGLKKRDGEDFEVDKAMFESFDTNGDGFVTIMEFEANLNPKTRKKIEEKLDAGWKFDKDAWDASAERHKDDE